MVQGRAHDGEDGGEPPLEVLEDARSLTEVVIEACGGTPAEADAIGTEVVLAIATYWHRHGFGRLAADEQAWMRYLQREILRRWLAALVGPPWTLSVSQSLARARLRALAERVHLAALDRELLERVHVFGFTVAEAACTTGLEVEEVARRLRRLGERLRFEHADDPHSPDEE